MNPVFTILKKEIIETLRDKRTLITMIIVPLLLFPVIMNVLALVQRNQIQKSETKALKIGIKGEAYSQDLIEYIENAENISWIPLEERADEQELIRSDSLDAVIVLSAQFTQDIDSLQSAQLHFFYQAVDNDRIKRRVMAPVEAYEKEILETRLARMNVTQSNIDPITINEQNIATEQEIIGNLVGGFLPYIFILFCFFGCYYPAIDLFTGEKERGTLETLLTLPVRRNQVLVGKMGVIALTGLMSALLSLVGLFVSLNLIEGLPQDLLTVIRDILKPGSVVILLGLLIPIAVFFAGLLIPIATRAKSFKEAQSQITPLNFLIIIPAAIGLLPGMKLTWATVFIPILNVALAIKEVVAGTIDYILLVVVFLSLIALAVVGIVLSLRSFSHERNVLQG